MFQTKTEEKIWQWRWPIIAVSVLAVLLALQMLRVNKRPEPSLHEIRTYTSLGPLISGDVVIPAAEYNSTRIDLNRRAKISGEFRTSNIKSRVSVLVIKESDFMSWKVDLKYYPIAQTGYVPGGKISPVLEPGTYFLILDNRRNDSSQSVHAEFVLN